MQCQMLKEGLARGIRASFHQLTAGDQSFLCTQAVGQNLFLSAILYGSIPHDSVLSQLEKDAS